MTVQQWVKDFVAEFGVDPIREPDRVFEPEKGQIVLFKPFHNTEHYKIGDCYKVEIIDGQYWGSYGLSNAWSWYRLTRNSKRGRKEHGYGCFYKIVE